MNNDNCISSYLSEHGYLVFKNIKDNDPLFNVLKSLNIRLSNIESIKQEKILVEFCYGESLYEITPENILFILSLYQPDTEGRMECANYTSITQGDCEPLKSYIENNISDYVENVMLVLPENKEEN